MSEKITHDERAKELWSWWHGNGTMTRQRFLDSMVGQFQAVENAKRDEMLMVMGVTKPGNCGECEHMDEGAYGPSCTHLEASRVVTYTVLEFGCKHFEPGEPTSAKS